MFKNGEFSHPDDLMRSWAHVVCAAWDPYEQYQMKAEKAPHINCGPHQIFEAHYSDHRGQVDFDVAKRFLPNGIIIRQLREFKKQLMPTGQYADWIKKPDIQKKFAPLIVNYGLEIGVLGDTGEELYGDDIPEWYQQEINQAISDISPKSDYNPPNLGAYAENAICVLTASVTAANTVMRDLTKIEAYSLRLQEFPIRSMSNDYNVVNPKIQKSVLPKLFTPLVNASGSVTGITRPYLFIHNGYGVDVHGEFETPMLKTAADKAIRKNTDDKAAAIVTRWNLRPFTLGEGHYDAYGYHTPAITTAEKMPRSTFESLDRVFSKFNGGIIGVPYSFTSTPDYKEVNKLLKMVKAMKPHEDILSRNMMAWCESRAPLFASPEYEPPDVRAAASGQGTLFRGKAQRPSSATPKMPPRPKSYA